MKDSKNAKLQELTALAVKKNDLQMIYQIRKEYLQSKVKSENK